MTGRALTIGDIVLVSFPFTDLSAAKVRPAAVVSRSMGSDVIVAFISSRVEREFPQAEVVVRPEDADFAETGLCVSSTIRLNKVATLDRTLLRRRIGRLSARQRERAAMALRHVFQI